MSVKKVDNKVDFISEEHKILNFWKENNTFDKRRNLNVGKPKWSFIDGPITANNPMGVHHAWGRSLKDIYNRYKSMKGFDLRYQNGFDCQGLWVEIEVEKELGFKSKKDVEEKFSGMINALSYGAPPHGGIAPGVDRIVMLLAEKENIREVTLFPMNQNAQDLMMQAPSEVDENQLKELSIKKDIKKN